MCGIAGFFDSSLTADQGKDLMHTMLKLTHHRGPDAFGFFADGPLVFGHNRLSIIDLTDTGAQPMEKDGLVITFNGEVYNYLEIKKELETLGHFFTSASDTEVILSSFKQWGGDCVKKFMGMWALAIWDKKAKTLFCSRDRFGIKPFNYCVKGDAFYFASEYRSLKISPAFTSGLNLAQVSRGLQLGFTSHRNETYFASISQLPSAHNLWYYDGKIRIEQYWKLEAGKEIPLSEAEKINAFKNGFEQSVRLHSRSDVEVGACLSGGLDSSSIASLYCSLFPNQSFRTFTIFYTGQNEVDERPFVNQILDQNKNIKPFFKEPTHDEILEDFDSFVNCQEIPPPGSSPYSQFFVMKMAASEKMKVLLDGQGSDEYLAGYHHTFFRVYAEWIKKFQWLKVLQDIAKRKKVLGLSVKESSQILMKSLVTLFRTESQILELEYNMKFPLLIPEISAKRAVSLPDYQTDRVREFSSNLLFDTTLPSLLHFEDRNSMWFSIESRVPFLDHRLVEFAYSLPIEDKIRDTWTKQILRSSMKGILPEGIRLRTDKKGFVTPGEKKWLAGSLKHLLNFDPSKIDFIDGKRAKLELEKYKKGDVRNAQLVWRLAVLNYWLAKN